MKRSMMTIYEQMLQDISALRAKACETVPVDRRSRDVLLNLLDMIDAELYMRSTMASAPSTGHNNQRPLREDNLRP